MMFAVVGEVTSSMIRLMIGFIIIVSIVQNNGQQQVVVVSAQQEQVASSGAWPNDPNMIQQVIVENIQTTLQTTPSSEPIILRYDQLTDALVNHVLNGIEPSTLLTNQEKINYVMNGLSTATFWNDVLFDATTQTYDLSLYVAALLGFLGLGNQYGFEPYPNFLETRSDILDLLSERNLFLIIV